MDARTLEALKGSIAKWEAIVAGTGFDRGGMNCPLCKLFAEKDYCAGCPVAQKAGKGGCWGTPYMAAVMENCGSNGWRIYDEHHPKHAESVTSAQAELDFLKSLLPPEEQ